MKDIFNRIQLLFASGVTALVGADKVQAKVLDAEVLSNIQRVEPYGFSYRPLPGSQAYLLFPSGDRSFGVAIVIGDKRYQLDLQPGEVALHDDQGNHVHLKHGGNIEVKASAKITIDAPIIDLVGSVKNNGKVIGSPHTHTSTSPGNQTSGVN